MKYVMFKGEDHYVPIIFPEILVHADVSGWMLADLLGPNEDFDGLVTALEDEASK